MWSFVFRKGEPEDFENPPPETAATSPEPVSEPMPEPVSEPVSEPMPASKSGACWDHVAICAEHRLALEVVCGRRNRDNCMALVCRVKSRTGGRTDLLLTSDGYKLYAECIRACYSTPVARPRKPGAGRPPLPLKVMPKDRCHATVIKHYKKGRVIKVERKVQIGDDELLRQYLDRSTVSNTVNTSFVERNNGSTRAFCSRKVRKTCRFSKDWDAHTAATAFTAYSHNFCRTVRTLAQKIDNRRVEHTPAMSAGLADHVWSMREWATFPARASAI